MNRLLLPFIAGLLATAASAQSYSEDFESFSTGDYICESTTEWVTWSGGVADAQDVQVVSDQAYSGSNSIYVNSTVGTGGPQDVVLEFGELFTEGLFEMDMWLLIEEGNGTYFNFQGEEAIGTTWALNMFLNQNGEFTVTDSNNETVMVFSYPVGEWFKISYNINLTLNNWSIAKDDLTIGAFSNDVNQIASLNVYPLNSADFGGNNQCSMWMDDISYSLTPFEIAGLNGALTNVVPNTSGLAGQTRDVAVTVNNYGETPITSFDVTYDYNGQTETQNITGVNMASLESIVVEFDDPISLAPGQNDLVVTLSNINGGMDDNSDDNVSTMALNPVVPADGKFVIIEEATGTWCPWCPRGAVMLDRMTNSYPDWHAGIAVHNEDPMTVAAYDAGYQPYIGGYPSGTVDRGPEVDPLGFEAGFLERVVVPVAATLDIAAEEDGANGLLNVSITYNFSENVNGQWRVECVLTEDGVTGTTSDYGQANAYAGGDFGEMGGYENLPATVPASQMVYDHVARALSPDVEGAPALPETITAGSSYTYNFSFEMDGEWNTDNMHIIGMLIEEGGVINNGGSAGYADALAGTFVQGEVIVGVEELAGPDALEAYPIPALDVINLDLNGIKSNVAVTIRNAAGQVVQNNSIWGDGIRAVNVASLTSGVYFLEVQSDDQPMRSLRFVKR